MEQVEAGLEILARAIGDEPITVYAWAFSAGARGRCALSYMTGMLQLLEGF